MRQLKVFGNWKMHGDRALIERLLTDMLATDVLGSQTAVAVFPPSVYLEQVARLAQGSVIAWGAQTVSEHASGAYTGEVAASMLNDLSCRYVLVGHSERRQLFNESNEIVAAKFAAAQQAGLMPVLCVGETLEQRENDQTLAVVKAQIDAVLKLASGVQGLAHAIIAYEPVWAIGTGKTATPSEAQAVHAAIREHVAAHNSQIADNLAILYGGSVKPDNANALFAESDIDGGLIGGASLAAESFCGIIRAANEIAQAANG